MGCADFDAPSLTLLDDKSEPAVVLALVHETDDSGEQHKLMPLLQLITPDGETQAWLSASALGNGSTILLGSDRDHDFSIAARGDSLVITKSDSNGHELRARVIDDNGTLRLEPIVDDKSSSNAQGQLSSRELDVMEAVFRYQFEHNRGGSMSGTHRIFLAVDRDRDPPPELLARFTGHEPTVEPRSAAEFDDEVHRPHEMDHGILFRIASVRWIDENTVDVIGGYHRGHLNSSEDEYRVERRDSKWIVVSDKLRWIS
jgi:hypothetical protein